MSDSFVIPWTIAQQAPLSMRFPRQKYWSGLPFPSSEDLSYPEAEPACPAWQVVSCIAIRFFTNELPGKPLFIIAAKSLQSCLTLCDPMDCSQTGSSVHDISQARILGWVAISSSRGYSQARDGTQVSCLYPLSHQERPFSMVSTSKSVTTSSPIS